jgi:membrane protease YdiL (CAAX protease family)
MAKLAAIFWNSEEQRVRAMWRLVLHTLAMLLLWELVRGLIPTVSKPWQWATGATAGAIVIVGATLVCGRGLDRRRLVDFGLHASPRWWADLGAGAAIGVVLMSGIFVVELGAGWLTIEDRFVGAAAGQSFALAFAAPLLLFISVAIAEELVFRGYWLRNLAEAALGDRLSSGQALAVATVISSVVFGVVHGGNPNVSAYAVFAIVLAGGMLAVGVLWTGELALPIGLHLTWNLFQGNVFGFAVSGTDAGPRVFMVRQTGPDWITGGEFGPEAGAIGLVAMIAGVALIAGWIRLSRGRVQLDGELGRSPEPTDARV